MALELFISEIQDPSNAVVSSRLTPVPVKLREFVFGESVETHLYLVDGDQDFSAISGEAGYSIKVAIGIPGETPAWQNSSWTLITDGWSGRIAPNTQDLLDLFDDGRFVELRFEVEITDGSGYKTKYASVPCRLVRRVITTTSDSDPLEDTMTGEFAIPNGADSVTVTGLNLESAPVRVLVQVTKPSGGFNIFATPIESSYATTGFQVDLSAQTDQTGYILNYMLVF